MSKKRKKGKERKEGKERKKTSLMLCHACHEKDRDKGKEGKG